MEEKRCYGCMKLKTASPICEHCGYDERTQNDPHRLPAGTVLKEQYLVGKVLGQGGFGITYLGWDLYLDIPVAIKEYYPAGVVMRDTTVTLDVVSSGGDEGARFRNNKERFLREAKMLARFSQVPEIVQVKNFFLANNTAYIVMEYVEGTTLKKYVADKGGRLSAEETLSILRPVIEALCKVHKTGLVHRDISPDNIMMLPGGGVKLLDFGAVRDVGEATVDKQLTKSTEAILKQGYAPIEQYQKRGSLGPWTDVYALCATIYYCLTGEVPPDAPERLLGYEDLNLQEKVPSLPEDLVKALEHGMALRSEQRTDSMDTLYQELFCQLAEETVPVTKPQPMTKQQPPVPAQKAGKENPKKKTASLSKKQGALIVGIVVVLTLICLVPLLSGRGSGLPDPAPDAETTPSVETTPSTETEQDMDFLAMLSNDSVKEIVLEADTRVRAQGVVEITKPVIVPEGCGLEAGFTSFLIQPGGSLEIRGQLEAYSSLVVREGGSLRVEDGGSCSVWHLWLEREENLVLEPGASANLFGVDFETQKNRDHDSALTILNENVFADAVTVTTARELLDAGEEGGPIVIAGNIILTEPVSLSRPVRIESGARVLGTLFLGEGGYLVNYGTLSGELNLGYRCAGAVNYRQLQGDVWLGGGALLNCGAMETETLCIDGGRLINYGTLNHIGSSDGKFLELRSLLINAGELTLGGSSPYLNLRGYTLMVNTGSVRVLAGAMADFNGILINVGSLTVERSGVLSGDGFIDMTDSADEGGLNMEPDSVLQFNGVIAYAGGEAARNRMEPAVTGAVDESILRWLSFSWDECYCWVDTSRMLKSWMDCESLPDGSTFTIGLSGNIKMNQTFTVNKGLAVSGGATLTVNGDLILEGENAFLYNDGTVDLAGHNLILRDGAMVVNRGCLRNVGSVLVSGASQSNSAAYSLLMNLSWEDCNYGNIILEQGGRFISLPPLNLEADVQVRDGTLMALGGLHQGSKRVEIGEQGYAHIALLLEMDADAILENRGTLEIEGWEPDPVVLGGTVNNYGTLVQYHDDWENSPLVQGTLNNYGIIESHRDTWVSGVLNNRGSIDLWEGSQLSAAGGGQITGSTPQVKED